MDGHLPAVAGEVVAHEVAFALIDQIGRVEIETLALPPLSEALRALVEAWVDRGCVRWPAGCPVR